MNYIIRKLLQKLVIPAAVCFLGISCSMTSYAQPSYSSPVSQQSAADPQRIDSKEPIRKLIMAHPVYGLSKGSSVQCKVKVSPASSSKEQLTFSSSKPEVAKVDKDGIITALKSGHATITCKSPSGLTAKCKVRVSKRKKQLVLDKYVQKLSVGAVSHMKVTLSGRNVSRKVSYYNANPDIVQVSPEGEITALSPGKTVITAIALDGSGLWTDCTIYVTDSDNENYSKTIFVGASRTKSKKQVLKDMTQDISFIARPGSCYPWFKNTAFPKLERKLNKNPKQNVVICMGVNDMQNVDKYISLCRQLMKNYPNTRIYVATVTPVDEVYTICKNSTIERFNHKLKPAFGSKLIDTYRYLKRNGIQTTDGVHYDKATAALELNYILKTIS